jgi:sugar-specific transcriptional regulator TrmB
MESTLDTLKLLGLNETEIKAYLTLLPLGPLPASVLSRRLHIPRSTAKYTCEQLAEKKLFARTQKNQTIFYYPNDPKKLEEILNEENRKIEEKRKVLKKTMGRFLELYQPGNSLPNITYYEGAEAVCEMLEDVLNENKTLYGALSISEDIHPTVEKYWKERYIPERKRREFHAKMIFYDDPIMRGYAKQDPAMKRTTLFIPKEEYPFDVCFQIYGDKVAFYSHLKTECSGVIIQNPHIRNMAFSLYKMAWNFARTLPSNKAHKNSSL